MKTDMIYVISASAESTDLVLRDLSDHHDRRSSAAS